MKEVWIRLLSTKDVQRFVNTLIPLSGDFELITGQFILDARSLMGILSLDLSKPLRLKVYNDNPENLAAIKPYMDNTEGAYHE